MAKFCENCGAKLNEEQDICLKCGIRVNKNNSNNYPEDSKSKMAAGFFGIFLGAFGVHNFYLGYTSKAVGQLLLTVLGWILFGLGPMAASIWGLVEGIMIFSGNITTDANGIPLHD